ncbi:hypothetical protein HDU85_000137 [Gaertneriomyces sp. JEL0708]|nr:hypothetical protein HDU85_000137 [Gaertneriomyces sp. JEL0708]
MGDVPPHQHGQGQRPVSDFRLGGFASAAGARPGSATMGSFQRHHEQRPSSEVLSAHYKSPEAEAIDQWFEDLNYYEKTLEEVARARLDENFRDELKYIEQWFTCITQPEQTTALYSLLQRTRPVQIRFFATVLQQMAQRDPVIAGSLGQKPGYSGAHEGAGHLSASGMPQDGPSAHARGPRRLLERPISDSPLHRDYSHPDHPSYPDDYTYKRTSFQSIRTANNNGPVRASAPSPLIRPKTPLEDDAISSADWSLNPATLPILPTDRTGAASPVTNAFASSPIVVTPPPDELSAGMSSLSLRGLQPPRSPHQRPTTPRGISPHRHPDSAWNHVQVGSAAPRSYSRSDYSDSASNDGMRDHDMDDSHDGRGGRLAGIGPLKEKGKIPEAVDLEAVKDIPGWLRSLRLHKYTPTFEHMDWKDMIKLDEDALIEKGVTALGARRKMLKVFELVRKELDAKVRQ